MEALEEEEADTNTDTNEETANADKETESTRIEDTELEDTHTTSNASLWSDELKSMLVRACVKVSLPDWMV
jgi:hypothetical protein